VARLFAGDRVEINTAGGGGYGDPEARNSVRRTEDLAGGKVSQQPARTD
jgi:N-methylhydantoinase B/oxoprolinase/acetone carboxylase alpha subunit